MIPRKHLLTLFFLCACIVAAVVTRKRSRTIALLSIVACVGYVMHGWAQGAGCKSPEEDNGQCLFGTSKNVAGLLAGGCVDVWHLYHLLFWVLIGLLAPGHVAFFAAASVLWELVEHAFFKVEKRVLGCQTCNSAFCGRVEDVAINVTGYLIGSAIAYRLPIR